MKTENDFNGPRKCHKAKFVNAKGRASALCYKTPHAIPNSELYVMFGNVGVTCKKCLAIIAEEAKKPLASQEKI